MDEKEKRGMPRATIVLLWIMVLVFLADMATSAMPLSRGFILYGDAFGLPTKYGRLVSFDKLNGQFWRIITYIFLHAGIPHLLVNAIALWIAGTILEKKTGSLQLLFCFFVTGVCAALIALFQIDGTVGASGAIYGIIGCLFFSGNLSVKEIGAVWKLILLILYLILPNLSAGTAIIVHITGFLTGAVLGLVLRKKITK